MFEDTKYHFYSELMETYLDLLEFAEETKNPRLIDRYSRKALKTGNKILPLEEKLGIDPRGSVKPLIDILKENILRDSMVVLVVKRS